ncbi:MAG: peptidase U32 family protein, partial [Clostridiaceae bacterium]
MNEIELLAPAGSYDSLIAAVNTGADAVYVGGNKFSARAKASNFDNETLIKAMNHCHLYGVKVYIAVNTLIKDQELNEAIEYIEFLNNQGVDGVIIQDIGLFNEIKKTHHNFENLEIHASTQMTIHNLEGARFLNTIGYKRIVLSRELSIEEITEISQEIETEIFVHGALCICYSGQCLMSSLIGGKSGNRGRCAQPCRLKYTFISEDKSNKVIQKEGYILSPKDISTFDFVDKILATKTKSLKIEGRMKTPEYVAGVVSAYRKKIDNVDFSQLSEKQEKKNLLKLFNREGFSKAYFFGNQY